MIYYNTNKITIKQKLKCAKIVGEGLFLEMAGTTFPTRVRQGGGGASEPESSLI